MLDEIGLFDETFFAYGDDTDIGLRGRVAGWKCIYVPTAIVYLLDIPAPLQPIHPKSILGRKNRVWILIKYFPISMILTSPFYTLIRFIFQAYGAITNKGAAGRFR